MNTSGFEVTVTLSAFCYLLCALNNYVYRNSHSHKIRVGYPLGVLLGSFKADVNSSMLPYQLGLGIIQPLAFFLFAATSSTETGSYVDISAFVGLLSTALLKFFWFNNNSRS
jgi:hypothetical protein